MPPTARAYRIDPQAFDRLIKQKGLTLSLFAQRVRFPIQTLRAWMRGRRAFLCNIDELAHALSTNVLAIILPGDIDDRLRTEYESNTVRVAVQNPVEIAYVELTLNEHFPSWNENKEKSSNFLKGLQLLCGAVGEIRIVGKPKAGSVVLILQLSTQQVCELELAFDTGKLEHLNVTGFNPLNFQGDSHLPQILDLDDNHETKNELNYSLLTLESKFFKSDKPFLGIAENADAPPSPETERGRYEIDMMSRFPAASLHKATIWANKPGDIILRFNDIEQNFFYGQIPQYVLDRLGIKLQVNEMDVITVKVLKYIHYGPIPMCLCEPERRPSLLRRIFGS